MDDKPVIPAEKEFADSEALATWSTRYMDASGYECVLTLQAETGADVLRKAQAAFVRLGELGCGPILHHQRSNNPGEKSETVMCPIHNVAMRQYQKKGRTWFAHKLDDSSWCKGG